MEILIKAKQADNPQFNFMNQNDPLYKYYRHILSAIKNGRYKIVDNKQGKNDYFILKKWYFKAFCCRKKYRRQRNGR